MICLPNEIVIFIILSAFLHKYLFGSGKCKAKFLNSEMVRRACCLPTDINFRFLVRINSRLDRIFFDGAIWVCCLLALCVDFNLFLAAVATT